MEGRDETRKHNTRPPAQPFGELLGGAFSRHVPLANGTMVELSDGDIDRRYRLIDTESGDPVLLYTPLVSATRTLDRDDDNLPTCLITTTSSSSSQ